MSKNIVTLCASACVAALTVIPISGAAAAIFVFAAPLTGDAENPPVVSPGSGFTTVTVDDVANTIRIETNFVDLLDNAVAAHLHLPAAFGENGPVATALPSLPGFPLGATSGSFDMTFDLTDANTYNAGFIASNGGNAAGAQAALVGGLQDGIVYFNLHSAAVPSGELRGNLTAVPEPMTWALMIAGFGLVGGALRRRKDKVRVRYA